MLLTTCDYNRKPQRFVVVASGVGVEEVSFFWNVSVVFEQVGGGV